MKKILIAAAAIATVTGAAGAASAQPWNYGQGTIDNKQNVVRERIMNGERSGRLTPNESAMLRGQLQDIAQQERAFRASYGISQREFNILNARLDHLRRVVDREARDRESTYGYGYGRDHERYDRYDRDGYRRW